MSAANVSKGKRFERDSANHATARFNSAGLEIEVVRRAATGLPEDHGDLFGIPYTAVQCKNTTKTDLTVVDQAQLQAARRGVPIGVLLQKRRQHPVGSSYVTLTFDRYLDLIIELERRR